MGGRKEEEEEEEEEWEKRTRDRLPPNHGIRMLQRTLLLLVGRRTPGSAHGSGSCNLV